MSANHVPQRILAIKLADLGDVLLCESALRSLRLAFPPARIDVLTPPSSIHVVALLGHDVRSISFPKHQFDRPRDLAHPRAFATAAGLAFRLRSARYDRVVILHHLTTPFGARKFALLARATGAQTIAGLDNGRGSFLTHRTIDLGFGAKHEAAYMLDIARAAGGAAVDPAPSIDLRGSDVELPPLPESYAVIFPATGAYSKAREWFPDRFGQVARHLAALGIQPVVVGGTDATSAATTIRAIEPGVISLTGATTIRQLAHILDRSRLVIGGDSFIGHLAAALGRPVISIFGPSNVDAWRPFGSLDDGGSDPPIAGRSLVVSYDIPCAPCVYTGFRLGRPGGCPDRTCLKLVTVEDVNTAISRVLGVAG